MWPAGTLQDWLHRLQRALLQLSSPTQPVFIAFDDVSVRPRLDRQPQDLAEPDIHRLVEFSRRNVSGSIYQYCYVSCHACLQKHPDS